MSAADKAFVDNDLPRAQSLYERVLSEPHFDPPPAYVSAACARLGIVLFKRDQPGRALDALSGCDPRDPDVQRWIRIVRTRLRERGIVESGR
jgi:hypothetical protein